MSYINHFLSLILEAAPWLIMGLLLGGLMKALLPTSLLNKHLKGRGLGSVIKAAILGAPLPLCSCGVIPAAIGLRQAGASKPATVSFLVSTPETGVDSITVTYALMGPFMAIARPIAALASAITAGILVSWFDKPHSHASTSPLVNTTAATTCCSSTEQSKPCCDSDNTSTHHHQPHSFIKKAISGIQYAFTTLLDGIVLWLLVGLLFAAAVKTFLPADFLAQWGQGLPAMLIMVIAGIPMYICATASTPIAAGLMLAGVSPGAALVLLLTGPATNISTLGIISKELGKRSMFYYLLGTVTVALLAGLTVDWLVNYYSIDIITQLHEQHNELPIELQWASLALLILLPLRKMLIPKKYRIN